ncbi:MAG: ATP-binding cassette domain-containing protein [Ardenticatenaceae bacterium]|nr:ATP-binding cassette domain-containing protein [Ardenticatenaceae bacterium]
MDNHTSSTRSSIVSINNLTRRYKEKTAVKNLNLSIAENQIFGLIGPNGAGKTTTVKMLTTLLAPSSGTATVNGYDIVTQARQVRQSIGYVPQEAQADEALSGREHLILQGRLYNMDKELMAQRIDEVLELVGLKEDADKRALEYSGGMRKLMDIATGLLHKPKVLFLDEPTSGVDVTHRQRILSHIRQLPAAGMTIFLTTHFLEEVDKLAHQVALLNNGQIIAKGTPQELKTSIGAAIVDVTLQDDTAVAQTAKTLQTESSIRKMVQDGNHLKLFTTGENDALLVVKQKLDGLSLVPQALSLTQPTLDDVFFYHLGKEVN